MIPDKIYVAVYPNDDGEGQHLGDWFSEPEYRAEDNIEYIRKEAVLALVDKLYDEAPSYDDSRVYLGRAYELINSL